MRKKKKIIIIMDADDNEIFKGRPITLPVKKEYVIQKSIEVFNDDDPCIIHQSHVVNMMINDFITDLTSTGNMEFIGQDILKEADFLDIKNIESCKIIIGTK